MRYRILVLLATMLLAGSAAARPSWSEHVLDPITSSNDLAITDLNGDGYSDVVSATGEGIHLYTLPNPTASPDLAPGQQVLYGQYEVEYQEVDAADFDGDGDQDLIVWGTSQRLSIWRNLDGAGTQWAEIFIRYVGYVFDLHGADMDGDGRAEILLVYEEDWGTDGFFAVSVFDLPAGEDTWVEYRMEEWWIALLNWPRFASPVDLDLDGDLDILGNINFTGDHEVGWYENPGALGQWTIHSLFVEQIRGAVAADVDGDGDNDVVMAGGQHFHVLRNNLNQNGYWSVDASLEVGATAYIVGTDDFDGDGASEVVVRTAPASESMYLFDRVAEEVWEGSPWATSLQEARHCELTDLNRDGHPDLVLERDFNPSPRVVWWQNLGSVDEPPLHWPGRSEGRMAATSAASVTTYPNPFNAHTTVTVQLHSPGDLTLRLVDITGRLVRTLAEGSRPAGTFTVDLEAGDLPSGVYFLSGVASGDVLTPRKLVLLR